MLHDLALAPQDDLADNERQDANQARVATLPAFAEWLYTTHMCYAVGRQHEIGAFEEMKNDPALKSY